MLSDEKLSHLSHRVFETLIRDKAVFFIEAEEKVLREIKRAIADELRIDSELDRIVRKRLASYSRKIAEGSREWDILYKKTLEEEMKKKHLNK